MSDGSTLRDLPPSAKLVYTVLREEGRLTQRQIAEHTMLSPRTVRYALSDLREADVVDEEINFMDARQRIYSLSADERELDAPAARR